MKPKLISAITYLSPKRDKPIIEWLAKQENKAEAIREALWAFIQTPSADSSTRQSAVSVAQATIDPEAIHQAVNQALAEYFDLSVIRQVVEAGVGNALTGLNVKGVSQTAAEDGDNWLDELNDNLMID